MTPFKYGAGAMALIAAGVTLHTQGCFAAAGSFLGINNMPLFAGMFNTHLASGGLFLWGSLGGTFLLAACAIAWTYYLSKTVYNYLTQATDKEKYDQALESSRKHINDIEKELVLCKGIINTLNDAFERAEHAHFDENGKLITHDQPARNKLQMLQWQEKNLKKINEVKNKFQRAALKRSIEGKVERKLGTPSKHGFTL